MTIRALGRRLRSGQASCVDLVEEALEQIRQRDRFNTFITLTPEAALEEAVGRDKELAAGIDRGPLHGIPTAYKDLFYTRGVRTTAGSLVYKDFVPTHDATVVAKLRTGGAVSLGKLNLHELAYGATSKNPHTGFVLNPHNPASIAGGSSGGSAVAVAAGFLPFTLGTDTGGSVRIPASYCGVAGLKPTYGRVSRFGVLPLAASLDHVGPLAASVEDCAYVMAEIAGWDPHDATSSREPVPNFHTPPPENCDGLRIGVPLNFYFDRVDPEVEAAVRQAVRDLERLGARTVDVRLPDIEEMNAAARIVQFGEVASLYAAQTDSSLFGDDVWALLQQGNLITASDYVSAQRLRARHRAEFDVLWRDLDLLATPATPVVAPPTAATEVDIDGYREDVRVASTRFTRAINFLGEPALSMPCGRSASGLPIGLQLIARPFGDARLLHVGQTLERFWERTNSPAR